MIRIVWEFRVRPDRTEEFERHYGRDGPWAVLFRGGRGYRETILLRDRDAPGRYLTIDVWEDEASFQSFREAHAAEYEATDRRCETLTLEERCLGLFESL